MKNISCILTLITLASLASLYAQDKNIIERIQNPPENGFGQQGILFELIDKLIAENNIDINL